MQAEWIVSGGCEAVRPNTVLANLIGQGLTDGGLSATAILVVDTPDRAAVGMLITMTDIVNGAIAHGV